MGLRSNKNEVPQIFKTGLVPYQRHPFGDYLIIQWCGFSQYIRQYYKKEVKFVYFSVDIFFIAACFSNDIFISSFHRWRKFLIYFWSNCALKHQYLMSNVDLPTSILNFRLTRHLLVPNRDCTERLLTVMRSFVVVMQKQVLSCLILRFHAAIAITYFSSLVNFDLCPNSYAKTSLIDNCFVCNSNVILMINKFLYTISSHKKLTLNKYEQYFLYT